jgi:ABC-2 type transport system ATP-binding protein
MSIEVNQLTKNFGRQTAVDHISFSAKKGEILGFLGPNGAGKTTTMKMICGYLKASSGSVSICKLDIEEQAIEAKRKIGYLPEHNPLYKDMYIREYLYFFGKLSKLSEPKKRAEELIELTGLTREQNKRIGSLSKGYRQRVGLSQALLHDPEVLVLDEPTSGLDPNQLVEIRQLIKNIGKQKTLIFSTHIMQEVQALCDRVMIINKGKIVADEPIQLLMEKTKGNKIISIEFSGDVNVDELRRIPNVKKVIAQGSGKYQLHSSPEHDIRDSLFKLSSSKSWMIRELKEEKSSVEEIFNELTKGKD